MKTYDIPANALLVDGKCFHGKLHPIKACRLPYKVCGEVVAQIDRDSLGSS